MVEGIKVETKQLDVGVVEGKALPLVHRKSNVKFSGYDCVKFLAHWAFIGLFCRSMRAQLNFRNRPIEKIQKGPRREEG